MRASNTGTSAEAYLFDDDIDSMYHICRVRAAVVFVPAVELLQFAQEAAQLSMVDQGHEAKLFQNCLSDSGQGLARACQEQLVHIEPAPLILLQSSSSDNSKTVCGSETDM